jgi:AsmA family protein
MPTFNGPMNASLMIRRGLMGLIVALAALIVMALGFAAAVDAGLFHKTFIHLVALYVGRAIEVKGPLKTQLFSRTPSVTAERVIVGNPPWMPAGPMAEIGELSLALQIPGWHRRFGVLKLSMKSATLHLARDSSGRANWQWSEQGAGSRKSSIVRGLSVPGAHVLLDDVRRHLRFDGTVSAAGGGFEPTSIEASGQLNGHKARFEIAADSLAVATHDAPYHFSFTERSSGSRLEGRGSLPRPFDFESIEVTFDAAGDDLKDLYFLTGVKLVSTGSYRLSGKFVREGLLFKFIELSLSSGQSDVHGSISIDSSSVRPQLDVKLDAQVLSLADLGAGASGRAAELEERGPFLLSNTPLNADGLRLDDAKISFHGRRVMVGRVALTDVSGQGTIDHGVFTTTALRADLFAGKLDAHLKLDARSDPPTAQADIKIANLQLDDIHHDNSTPSPMEGLMQVRAALTGKGSSLHQLAATANGTVTAEVSGGTVRESLAELAGIDLRALGLLLAKDKRETELRCAIAILKGHDGTFTVQRLLVDTQPVLINGQGEINLGTEAIDLAIYGQPKNLRLFRFHSPVTVKGTLSHPSIDIQAHQLRIIDPAQAKDVDCASLTAAADSAH